MNKALAITYRTLGALIMLSAPFVSAYTLDATVYLNGFNITNGNVSIFASFVWLMFLWAALSALVILAGFAVFASGFDDKDAPTVEDVNV